MPDTSTIHDILAAYQRAMLDLDADALADLYAPDAVHEFPFAFPGMPPRFEGREAIRAGYRAAWGAATSGPEEIRDVVVHESGAGVEGEEVLVVEQVVVAAAFRVPGLLVLRAREGRLVHVRDYMDGLGVARATGRV